MQKAFEKIKEKIAIQKENHEKYDLYEKPEEVFDDVVKIINQIAEESRDVHFGCNTNGEHEKCNGCGMAEKCPDYKREWFEKLKNDVSEISISHTAWETIYRRLLEVIDEYAAVGDIANATDCKKFSNLLRHYKEQLTEEADSKLTNGDRIRSMNNKELAELIPCPYDTTGEPEEIMPCIKEAGAPDFISPEYCRKCRLYWLERECL